MYIYMCTFIYIYIYKYIYISQRCALGIRLRRWLRTRGQAHINDRRPSKLGWMAKTEYASNLVCKFWDSRLPQSQTPDGAG